MVLLSAVGIVRCASWLENGRVAKLALLVGIETLIVLALFLLRVERTVCA